MLEFLKALNGKVERFYEMWKPTAINLGVALFAIVVSYLVLSQVFSSTGGNKTFFGVILFYLVYFVIFVIILAIATMVEMWLRVRRRLMREHEMLRMRAAETVRRRRSQTRILYDDETYQQHLKEGRIIVLAPEKRSDQ